MRLVPAVTLAGFSLVFAEEFSSTCGDQTSLLQAKISPHAPDSKPGTQANLVLTSVTDLAKSFTQSSSITKTPEEVQAGLAAATAVLDSMRPILVEEHNLAQNQVDRQFAEIDACRTHATRGVISTEANAADVETARASANQCNAELAQEQSVQNSAQDDWDMLVSTLVNSQPGRLTATNFYSGFIMWKQWIESEEPTVVARLAALNAATTASETRTEECASKTTNYDEAFCQHRLSCAMLGACQAHETQLYHEMMDDINQAMDSRQAQSATIEQVDCLLQLISTAVETNNTLPEDVLAACEPAIGNNPDLLITFHPVPNVLECPSPAADDPECPGLADVGEIGDWAAGEVVETAAALVIPELSRSALTFGHWSGTTFVTSNPNCGSGEGVFDPPDAKRCTSECSYLDMCIGHMPQQWFAYEFSEPTNIGEYRWQTMDGECPESWTVQTSSDGSTWTDVSSESGQICGSWNWSGMAGEWKTYATGTTAKATHWRWRLESVHMHHGNGDGYRLYAIEFSGIP